MWIRWSIRPTSSQISLTCNCTQTDVNPVAHPSHIQAHFAYMCPNRCGSIGASVAHPGTIRIYRLRQMRIYSHIHRTSGHFFCHTSVTHLETFRIYMYPNRCASIHTSVVPPSTFPIYICANRSTSVATHPHIQIWIFFFALWAYILFTHPVHTSVTHPHIHHTSTHPNLKFFLCVLGGKKNFF